MGGGDFAGENVCDNGEANSRLLRDELCEDELDPSEFSFDSFIISIYLLLKHVD